MLDRPIFVIGTGRCGTTMMFDLLAAHPFCAWPCTWLDSRTGTRGKYPEPEPYRMWDRLYRGFARPCRDLSASDVPNGLGEEVQKLFAEQAAFMQRPRLLTKWTGWSRIGFIEKVCPGALYLNVLRDGRAVAWSLMQQPWWRGWEGPGNWRWGPLSEEQEKRWYDGGRSFYVLAGLQWARLADNIAEKGIQLGGRILTVRYEDLMSGFQGAMNRVLEWAGLPRDARFNDVLDRFRPRDANGKWQRECPPEEQERFVQALEPALARRGY